MAKRITTEEKAELLKATQENRRSKAIHLATMLALHAGLRDKEVRTLQWSRLDLEKRIVTVGQSKAVGSTIPINNDLFLAATE